MKEAHADAQATALEHAMNLEQGHAELMHREADLRASFASQLGDLKAAHDDEKSQIESRLVKAHSMELGRMAADARAAELALKESRRNVILKQLQAQVGSLNLRIVRAWHGVVVARKEEEAQRQNELASADSHAKQLAAVESNHALSIEAHEATAVAQKAALEQMGEAHRQENLDLIVSLSSTETELALARAEHLAALADQHAKVGQGNTVHQHLTNNMSSITSLATCTHSTPAYWMRLRRNTNAKSRSSTWFSRSIRALQRTHQLSWTRSTLILRGWKQPTKLRCTSLKQQITSSRSGSKRSKRSMVGRRHHANPQFHDSAKPTTPQHLHNRE